ncbi:hypothetical protein PT015_14855 [Candidatus Mycobacterium wuenschmannii]|uniref:Uncharacterized protein n=1 Tax=Candidatus Mycobacterium wuenschmannii TaxID=3027808 RepID=A0ABY8VTS6_9MYCO|nr:hypothetical protein [Candidatus Mycobacterium wuenschmannii]WIM86189.1 hypothetical protein PT015_14855 [Candidatus Mycobacterium wuenschmannii]
MTTKNGEQQEIWQDFGDAVNMTTAEIRHWPDDDKSTSAGQK